MADEKNNNPKVEDREISKIYEEIKNSQSASEHYIPFLEAMEKLNTEMKGLMKADENGWKLLDKDRFKSLSEKYRDAGGFLEQYLYRSRNITDPNELALREKCKRLSALMSADATVLRQYRPKTAKEYKSLPTLLEESRIPVMDQGSQKIKSVGGAQSSRFPMTIIGPNGELLPGMFTKADVFDPVGECNIAGEAAAEKAATPQGADLLRNFISAYKTYYTANPDPDKPVGNDPDMVNFCLMGLRKPGGGTGDFTIKADRFAQELARVNGMTVEQVKNACGKDALKQFCSVLHFKKVFDIYIKSREVKMEPGARVDRKNAGVSMVAELLGVPQVICHAEPMKLKGPDGEIVDGTFMAFADGIDPAKPGHEAFMMGRDSLKNTDGRGLEAIADLQVIDYLCGNVDRHSGNVFYQIDKNGKLIGVQGIDNDSSLGKIVPQGPNDKYRRTVTPGTMGAISKKMAERIMNLSTPELAFALRGTVDEPSIEAACRRLVVLKKAIETSREKLPKGTSIKYPYIRELSTKDFGKEKVVTELTKKSADNHFCEFKKKIETVAGRATAENDFRYPELIGSTNRATEPGVLGQILKADAFTKKLSDCTSFWRGSSSQNYIDLENAVKDYRALQVKIRDRMRRMQEKAEAGDGSPETLFGQYVTAFDMDKMRQSLKKLQTAADKYAKDKRTELKSAGKSIDSDTYIKNRIEAAEEISRFAKEGQQASQEEKESLASNDRRAMEQYARKETAAEKNKGNDDLIINNREPEKDNLIIQP